MKINGLEHIDKNVFEKVYGVDIYEGKTAFVSTLWSKLHKGDMEPVIALFKGFSGGLRGIST